MNKEMRNELNEQDVETEKKGQLTKKDVTQTFIRWWFSIEMGENFERMQAMSFCGSMGPVLKKLYKNTEDLKADLKRHMTFLNTEGMFGGAILGTVIAMEEQKANGEDIPEEAIIGLKTGLMGPMAGLGDSIDWATLAPLGRAAAAGMALAGNVLAPIAMVILSVVQFMIGFYMTHMGYSLGRESLKKILGSGVIRDVMNGANIVGLFMMGALTASYVKLSTTLSVDIQGTVVEFQKILDGIAPGLLQLAVLFGVYWILKFKKKSPSIVVVGIIVLGVILSLLGVC